ncbi:MAG: alanine racemase [Candidatus Nanopelagicales bacterium]
MFLDVLRRRNPELIRAAVDLHQQGLLPANSYVLDLEQVGVNASLMAAEARRLGLTAFAMTKQYGRNPIVTRAVMDAGFSGVVAVDVPCARPSVDAGIRIGHIGHLVQVPRHETAEVASWGPDYWTVFNDEHAQWAADVSAARGSVQALLARVTAPGDHFYPGHEGGFAASDVVALADRIDAREGARLAGVTTFPALLFDPETGGVRTTPNMATIENCAQALLDSGRSEVVVNAPGTTSMRAMHVLADAGATQVEPGHALTGTTPWHALEDLPEGPAMAYVSEISHVHGGRAYFYGGGLYADPVLGTYPDAAAGLIGRDADSLTSVTALLPPASAIDYYGQIPVADRPPRPGNTVVLAHRIQAFVTRAYVVPLSGVGRGDPQIEGVWTVDGRQVEARHMDPRP